MREHQDSSSGGLDHGQFVRFILEIDNPDEFLHIGAASMLSRLGQHERCVFLSFFMFVFARFF